MSYRNDLESAHRRIAVLEAERAALVAEIEAIAAKARGPAPTPPSAPPWRGTGTEILLAILATVAFYVLVIAVYDGQPPHPNAEHVAAWIGALLPTIASSRLWWTRKADKAWLFANAVRAATVLAIASGVFQGFSRFGQDFVFFWWTPIASVALLLCEIAAARALDRRSGREDASAETRIRVGAEERSASVEADAVVDADEADDVPSGAKATVSRGTES